MSAVPLPAVHQSPDGFYGINNEYLMSGPKGFQEFKMLENNIMFVRMDFPGVAEDGVSVTLEPSKQLVTVRAHAPKVTHDISHREYLIITGLVCKCCEISGLTHQMTDGALRLHISKTNIVDPQSPSCNSFLGGIRFRGDDRPGCKCPHRLPYNRDPYHPDLTGPVVMAHPNVREGTTMAYESKQLENGSLFVRLDMPGVPKENFNVSVSRGRVKVTGQAPAVSHDSGGRFYSGDVAMLAAPIDVPNPSRRIETSIENGVVRLIIPPV